MSVVIDRFEGEWAVLVARDAREGDVLDPSSWQVDRLATEQAKAALRATREAAFAGKKSTPGGSI